VSAMEALSTVTIKLVVDGGGGVVVVAWGVPFALYPATVVSTVIVANSNFRCWIFWKFIL